MTLAIIVLSALVIITLLLYIRNTYKMDEYYDELEDKVTDEIMEIWQYLKNLDSDVDKLFEYINSDKTNNNPVQ